MRATQQVMKSARMVLVAPRSQQPGNQQQLKRSSIGRSNNIKVIVAW
jgi:hypothetical protein